MTEVVNPQEKKRTFETYELTVSKQEILTPRVKGIRFQYPAGRTMSFQAGQFIQIFIPTNEPKPRRTSYSVASPPTWKEYLELCITLVEGGISSTFLHNLKTGDKVKAMGPLGKFTLPETIAQDLVFIATGSGIAPFRSMILDLIHKKVQKDIYLIFGNRFVDDVIYRKEWEQLVKENKNFHLLFTLSKPDSSWQEKKGYVQDMIQDFVPDAAHKSYYICGLVKMIEAVTEKLKTLGVSTEHVHYERYD